MQRTNLLYPDPDPTPRKLAASDSAKIQEGIGSSPNSALPKLREHGPHDRSPASEPRTQLQLWSKLTFSSPRTPSFSPKNRSKYTAPISHREHILFLQKSPSHPCRSARAELNQMKAPFFESSWRTRVNLATLPNQPRESKAHPCRMARVVEILNEGSQITIPNPSLLSYRTLSHRLPSSGIPGSVFFKHPCGTKSRMA